MKMENVQVSAITSSRPFSIASELGEHVWVCVFLLALSHSRLKYGQMLWSISPHVPIFLGIRKNSSKINLCDVESMVRTYHSSRRAFMNH